MQLRVCVVCLWNRNAPTWGGGGLSEVRLCALTDGAIGRPSPRNDDSPAQ